MTNFLGLQHSAYHTFRVVDALIPRIYATPAFQGSHVTQFEEVEIELRGELTRACVDAYRTPGYGSYPYLDAE